VNGRVAHDDAAALDVRSRSRALERRVAGCERVAYGQAMRLPSSRRPPMGALALSLSAVAAVAGLSLAAAACSSASEGVLPEAGTSGYVSDGGGGGDAVVDASAPVKPDAAPDAPLATPAVRYVGRTRTTSAGVECGWSGCRAIARFQGTAASLAIGEVAGENAFYDVLVDGTLQPNPINPTLATETFVLASGLPDGAHTVEVFKRSEAFDGTETFQGFTFPSGGALLAPPPPAAHTVEFIGDSVTAGYGVLGASNACVGAADNTNARLSFAGVAAATLGVDATYIAYSGKGITRNYDHTDNQMLADLFLMTTVVDGAPTWSFPPNPRDAVVIALGANDFTTDNNSSPSQGAFQTKYGQLLALVRAKYPGAIIFATYTPTMYGAGLATVRAAIPAAITALADSKTFFIDTIPDPDPTGTDTTGCEYHPNIAYGAQVGAAVAAFIKLKTGW
jgi:lysophospholipase L1-like esterase